MTILKAWWSVTHKTKSYPHMTLKCGHHHSTGHLAELCMKRLQKKHPTIKYAIKFDY